VNTKLFSELGLSAEMLKAIDKLGFEKASPVQAEAIPLLLEGRDVIGQSQTGSGKTAAFAIPAIEKVDPQLRVVQVIILCPTRELAVQVAEEVHKLSLFKRGIHALPIYGGQSYERQFAGLQAGAQIVIGTPGRVMDHMRRGSLRLEQVRMVILDEADVMLDMGFRDDIDLILKSVPPQRQTVFFSATLPRAIMDLIGRHARNPQNVRIEQKTVTVPTVEQVFYEVDRRFKLELLTRLIDIHDLKLGIIFCNTKRTVDDLADHLNAQGYSADRLHGDMSQGMRDRVMNKFRRSNLEFLVATDVAARGIDVENVEVVFNYDLPYDVEDYVHRIGRTGRAGRSGRAISFVAGRELFKINHIERYTKTRIHRAKPPTPNEVEEARAGALIGRLRETLKTGQYRKQDHLLETLLEEGFNSTDIASALIHYLQDGQSKPGGESATLPDRGEDQHPRGERGSRNDGMERSARGQRAHRGERTARGEAGDHGKHRDRVDRGDGAGRGNGEPRDRQAKPEKTDRAEPMVHKPLPPRESQPAEPPRPRRALAENHTRLFVGAGEHNRLTREQVSNLVATVAGVPATLIKEVDIRDRHTFVDVPSEHAEAIVEKLNRYRLLDRRLKVKVA
jgi:ATP-dependent RNA helicase DeaD